MDRYDLYELAVTYPPRLARFIDAVHGRRPRILREDFSGSAALARHWAGLSPKHTAIAVDLDREPLARAAGTPRLAIRRADVRRAHDRADIIACTNFPLGYWHTRRDLVAYLKHARACLRPRGLFIADLYGGADAFEPGRTTTRLRGPGGERIEYTFEQRSADPITGRVVDALHFKVRERGRARATIIRDAFIYDWRLWSIPELADAYAEAGFRAIEVYNTLGDAIDQDGQLHVRPVQPGEDLGRSWVVYLTGRK
ncbi:MAG: class I SAM-dependent methyltransferase [Phycisphaerales bacterium]|nr:class I SAM-dependent methyltransferase [Phycisphaerales bacterium]